MERFKTIIIIAVTVIFGATVAWKTLAHEARAQAEVTGPTKALAQAIEAGDPSAAPAGGEGYVKGVRDHFGRVREARFLDAYTDRTGSGAAATTDVVAEVLVRGRRGAGVLEVEFDGATIAGVEEILPDDVHTDLGAADRAAVERGLARRGGKVALSLLDHDFALNGSVR